MKLEQLKNKGVKYRAIADRIGMNHTVFTRKVKGSPNANSKFYFTDAEKDAIRAAVAGIGQDLIDAAQALDIE